MIEILLNIFVIIACALFFSMLVWFVWESSKIISERNQLRKDTGKYYDDEIYEELLKKEASKSKDKE